MSNKAKKRKHSEETKIKISNAGKIKTVDRTIGSLKKKLLPSNRKLRRIISKYGMTDYVIKFISEGNKKIYEANVKGLYLGVSLCKSTGKYKARLGEIHIGYYDEIIDAALAYNIKAFEVYESSTFLNFVCHQNYSCKTQKI